MPSLEKGLVQRILASSGVPRDAVLLVHSAIKGLSHEGFKAEAIIESMLDYLKDGTLLMPTMSWRTVTPENPIFDELATPSHTGVLTEIFRTRYATHRSLHPTHSVAGAGPAAGILLSSHHLGNTPVPATSPYGLVRDYPAFVLLLGVGLESCTAIHHPEELIAPEIYVKPNEEVEEYDLRARDGRVITYHLRRHLRLPRCFDNFLSELKLDGMRVEKVGPVPWALLSLDSLMRIVFSRLLLNRYATLAGQTY